MTIRNKILLYFSSTVISLTVISSVIIYILFAEYREEEFQQRQKQKVALTIKFLSDYQEMSEELTHIMDKLTIHDFYDEKVMIFNNNKKLVYKSIDDLKIDKYKEILNNLSPATQWIETKENKYDLVGVYVENGSNHFYAISKAYDEFGYAKLNFLRYILIGITIFISIIVLLVTYYLSGKISKPIHLLAEKLSDLKLDDEYFSPLNIQTNSYELKYLTDKINQLTTRTNEAFAFQKHAVQHISHELKTPIAILVSELEKAKQEPDNEKKNKMISAQMVKAKSLGDIINALLEISKIESGQQLNKIDFRMDELVFELLAEQAELNPNFQFDVQFQPEVFNDNRLTCHANKLLMKQAIANVLENAVKFSADAKAKIIFDCSQMAYNSIHFINLGNAISKEEEKYLFYHFFRGKHSQSVPGFGLGLVLAQKILQLHGGKISYSGAETHTHCFEIQFPLS